MIHIFWPIQQYTTLPRTGGHRRYLNIESGWHWRTSSESSSCSELRSECQVPAPGCSLVSPRMFLHGHKVQLQHFYLKLTCLWRGPVWELLLQSCTLSSSNMSLKFLAKSGSYFHGAVRRKPGASTGAWKLICFLVPPCNCSCLGCWGDQKR